MKQSVNDQLVHFLSDLYSVEQQALIQMKVAPRMAGSPTIAEDFRKHYQETELHAKLIHARLAEYGVAPSAVKDAIMKAGGIGFLLFARLQPETPGKLLNHAYSYEAMEWAGYEMLLHFAEKVNDYKSVEAAQTIKAQELAMMQRVKSNFDLAEQMTHTDLTKEKLHEHLKKHLADVHAFAVQSKQLFGKSKEIGGNKQLNELYKHQLNQTEKHAIQIEKHLHSLDAHASKLKDSALALGGLNWGLFFQYQSDTPAKLAAFIYAVLHLEMGGYHLLQKTASRAGDHQLAAMCHSILQEKENMAHTLAQAFDTAALATLDLIKR